MPRFLGIDYGTKRIGVAISDSGATIVSPLATVEARGDVTEQVKSVLRLAADYEVDAFVVGLPLNMDDTEGKQAKISRRFGEELARVSGKTVHYVDERLSSFAAKETLREMGLSRKKRKARVDRLAAQTLLQHFLDQRIENSE